MSSVPTVRVAHPEHGAAVINESDLDDWKQLGYKLAPLKPAKAVKPEGSKPGAPAKPGATEGEGDVPPAGEQQLAGDQPPQP